MLYKDHAATKARKFKSSKSFVRIDGSEVLHGRDWNARKWELWYRFAGLCERLSLLGKSHANGCSGQGEEPHHIIPRSVFRDDRLTNLASLSHACHLAEDPRKTRFGEGDKPVRKRKVRA